YSALTTPLQTTTTHTTTSLTLTLTLIHTIYPHSLTCTTPYHHYLLYCYLHLIHDANAKVIKEILCYPRAWLQRLQVPIGILLLPTTTTTSTATERLPTGQEIPNG
ncbi:hypothetical protein K457DRAFT_1374024, partial [Linnemannia elongata AG-77]